MSMETVLVTGAAGFIGPQVVKLLLEETDYRVIVLDKLTYAARVEHGEPVSLKSVLEPLEKSTDIKNRYAFIQWDICDPHIKDLLEASKVDYIINLAAESHVDRSIGDTPEFLLTEIHGTRNLLEAIRKQNAREGHRVKRAVFVSTDEVYGSIDRIADYEGDKWYALSDDEVRELIKKHQFRETTSLAGGSPYASSKGGADLLVGAYFNTHRWDPATGKIDPTRMPVMITRGANNFGPFQHPEKLIPLAICTLLMPDVAGDKRRIPVYDKGLAIREWIHTEDHARAIIEVLQRGNIGEIYNVGSGNRCRNRDLLLAIFRACQPEARKNGFDALASATFDATTRGGIVRPGHDLCYSINCDKLRSSESLNWRPTHIANFEQEIRDVVAWYKEHPDWWQPIWTGQDFIAYWNRKSRVIQEKSDSSFDFYPQYEQRPTLEQSLL